MDKLIKDSKYIQSLENKDDDINGKCFIDQLAAQRRVIEGHKQPEHGFLFAKVEALYGNEQYKRYKKQGEPDKLIVAKDQDHQTDARDGYMESGV